MVSSPRASDTVDDDDDDDVAVTNTTSRQARQKQRQQQQQQQQQRSLITADRSGAATTGSRTTAAKAKQQQQRNSRDRAPLAQHRIYLEVKNHITSTKLEGKIKELGGDLEVFFIPEVTLVITDREEWSSVSAQCAKTPGTPSNNRPSSVYSEHGTPQHNNDKTPCRNRPKTRADAMLEKARNTPTFKGKDTLLEQARLHGIAVWSVEKALSWLEKLAATAVKSKQQKPRIRRLKTPYVKFESFDRKHRPVFFEAFTWPRFNWTGREGSAAILHRPLDMTRKSKPGVATTTTTNNTQKAAAATTAAQPGYCEVCRCEYRRLDEHVGTKKHLNFVRDNANFIELDSLIKDGTDIENFLKVNCVAKEEKCNGVNGSRPHRMPRTRTSSLCDRVRNSPNGSSDPHARLRTRKTLPHSYVELEIDDDEIPMQPIEPSREIRTSQRTALLKIAEQESDTWTSGRPKRTCNKSKLISIDNNVISENRGYYKVEVPVKQEKLSPIPVAPTTDDKSIIVKFRRMRMSELLQLNNEAENFLFPKKDDSSSEEGGEADTDPPNTTASTIKDESTVLLSSEDDDTRHDDESVSSSVQSGKRKKRLTQAEAFILDNKKYYKFETPGSRLRYHGSLMGDIHLQNKSATTAATSTRTNGDVVSPNVKEEEDSVDEQAEDEAANINFTLEELRFSFEQVPKSEPWYETFERQDQGMQYYTCFSDSGCWKPFLLPYEMGSIPPLDPRICVQTYSQVKKQILDEVSSGTNSASCSTPDPSSYDDTVPPESTEEDSQASEDSLVQTESSLDSMPLNIRAKRKRRSKLELEAVKVGRNPRKSPRQHASTLAILSSLIQQRKKRGPRKSLGVIPETAEGEKVEDIAKSIDDLLTSAMDDEEIELCVADDAVIDDADFNFSCKLDVMKVLEDYDKCKVAERLSPKRRTPGKKPGRKKKKNRTGWPSINRRNRTHNAVKDETVPAESVQSDAGDDEDNDEVDRVKAPQSVDLDRWENAEKVLAAKVVEAAPQNNLQPFVRVHKLDGVKRRLRSSVSPPPAPKRTRRGPASPTRSPRALRRPRGRWYRER